MTKRGANQVRPRFSGSERKVPSGPLARGGSPQDAESGEQGGDLLRGGALEGGAPGDLQPRVQTQVQKSEPGNQPRERPGDRPGEPVSIEPEFGEFCEESHPLGQGPREPVQAEVELRQKPEVADLRRDVSLDSVAAQVKHG
eukprot:CAMPEP_0172620016 /NCGR_PEP_ID=MMETSP1068-20121228/99274_1 /TAXON_ID=35684 /ORGANISM="Pseudopedinella elastica, Strain CCMP716" /LENGTH=141 /DNA_ID=CAMNT_0013427077 /DNA_START=56 /DNA_END=482 /DNA_ORIENTATION=-